MTSLHALITALVRLLGLFYFVKALDNAAAPFFYLAQVAAMPDMQVPNPWIMFLPMVGFYIVVAAAIFFAAPKITQIMIGAEVDRKAEVPWHETLLFCTGGLIIAWAFVRLTDTVYGLVVSATTNDGRYAMGNAMLIYIFMTAVLLGAGVLLIAKLHRISAWITARPTKSEQDAAEQPATVSEPE